MYSLTAAQSEGEYDAPVLIVVDAPSSSDAAAGKLLDDGDGRRFWKFAAHAGVAQQDCYVVAVVGEEGVKKVGRGRLTVSPVQVLKWRERFESLVKMSLAQTVVVMGGVALSAFAGLKGGIEKWRGYVVLPSELPESVRTKCVVLRKRKNSVVCACRTSLMEEYFGVRGGRKRRKVYITDAECRVCWGSGFKAKAGDFVKASQFVELPPPARLVRNAQYLLPVLDPVTVRFSGFALAGVFAADLKRAGRAHRRELRLASTEFAEVAEVFDGDGAIAVDIETNGLTDDIVRIGVGDEHRTWSTPWQQGLDATRAMMASGRTVLIHNAGFDEPRLRAAGAPISGPIFCTMLATYMVQPDGRKGLNWAISLFLDAQRHKHLSGEQPALYNALDVRRTWDLHAPLVRELERTGQREYFESGVMSAVRTLIRMSERGLKIDQGWLAKWRGELVGQDAHWTGEWERMAPGVNPAAPLSVAAHLGLQCVDEDALVVARTRVSTTFEQQRIDALLGLRTARQAYRYTEFEIGEDGCVHPGYLPGAKDDDAEHNAGGKPQGRGIAYSGRWTASHPPMQQIPRPPKLGRHMVVPHTKGNVLVEADWSQFELRVTAAMSGDAALQEDLDSEDIFARLAAAVGCERSIAKTGVYLSAYLGSPRTLHAKFRVEGVNISYQQCVEFQSALFKRYHRWAGWRREVIAEVERARELRNPFGKWAPFPMGRADASRAVNFLPQSVNASVMTLTLPVAEAALERFGAVLLTLVHDSLLVESPPQHAAAVGAALREVMGVEWAQVANGFRVPVSVKVGSNWGQMAEVGEAAIA